MRSKNDCGRTDRPDLVSRNRTRSFRMSIAAGVAADFARARHVAVRHVAARRGAVVNRAIGVWRGSDRSLAGAVTAVRACIGARRQQRNEHQESGDCAHVGSPPRRCGVCMGSQREMARTWRRCSGGSEWAAMASDACVGRHARSQRQSKGHRARAALSSTEATRRPIS